MTCSRCKGTGEIRFMNMHPEDYTPPKPCPDCTPDPAPADPEGEARDEYPVWIHAFYDDHTGGPREATQGELEEAAALGLSIERFSVAPGWDYKEGRRRIDAKDRKIAELEQTIHWYENEVEEAQGEIDRLRGCSDSAEDRGPE